MPRPLLTSPSHRRSLATHVRTLAPSALSHAGRRKLAPAFHCFVLACGVLAAGCDHAADGAGPKVTREELQRQVDQLVAAYTPISESGTSDKQDAWFHHQVAVLEQSRKSTPQFGEAALARFAAGTDKLPDIRAALLDAAAHCSPEAAAPVLEKLIRTYDGEMGLGLRTRAVAFLAETSPARAIAMYEPLLRDPLPHQTRPSQEAFVIGWTTAAHKLQVTDARVLCDVAVDLKQPPDARYAAITALGDFGGQRAIKALQEVLVEANSDGLMRRKAVQALLRIMPKPEFCALITQMSQIESDLVFVDFLADMIDHNCGQ